MQVPVVGFIPPIVGCDGEFNTFRLGQAFAKRLQPGGMVYLMDEKIKVVFGRAIVVDCHMGQLKQMCLLHGAKNHTEVGKPDAEASPDRLFAYIQKIYGPHIATEAKKCAVIYMRRIADESGIDEHNAIRQAQG